MAQFDAAQRPEAIWLNARLATLVAGKPGLGAIARGALAARAGRLTFVGDEADLPAAWRDSAETVDCGGRWITPGLIDCHTHLVYAGDRAHEFELRLAGARYEEIARAGGGIAATVRATRAASEDELVRQSLPRLDALIAEGATTVEVKSGYGLELDAERRMLRAARRLAAERRIGVRTTFLGAHATPPEFSSDRGAYLATVIDEMLPALAGEGLIDAVDGFCETIAFAPAEIARLFAAAHALKPAGQAARRSIVGRTRSGARRQLRRAVRRPSRIRCRGGRRGDGRAGIVAVLLPGAFYTLHEKQAPPVALFRKHWVRMAVATDCNPGTSPMTSLLLALNMARDPIRT